MEQRIDALLEALREAPRKAIVYDTLAVRHFWVINAFVSGALLAETTAVRQAGSAAVEASPALDPVACPSLAALGPALATCDFATEYAFGLDTVLAAVPSLSAAAALRADRHLAPASVHDGHTKPDGAL